MKMNAMDWIAWVLLFIGGLDWGTVGFFKYDFVAKWFGSGDPTAAFPRVIYALVGLAALWSLITVFGKGNGGSMSSGSNNM